MTAVKCKAKGNSLGSRVWREPQKVGREVVRWGGCFSPFATGQRYVQPWASRRHAPVCVGTMGLCRTSWLPVMETLLTGLKQEEKNAVASIICICRSGAFCGGAGIQESQLSQACCSSSLLSLWTHLSKDWGHSSGWPWAP